MEVKIGLTAIYLVLFIIAVAGNSLVAFLVLKRPGMKSPTNLLLVNMAVADILVAVFMIPLATLRYHVGSLWIGGAFGAFSCRAMFYVSHLPIAGSTTTLTFIAFERFFAIMYPYRRIVFFSKVKLVTLLIWLSAALLMIPIAISASTSQVNGKTRCNRYWSVFGNAKTVEQTFYLTTFLVMYTAPLLIMGVVYTVICHKLWKHQAPGHVTVSIQQTEAIHRHQVVRMLMTVVIVFALCWLPMYTQHIMYIFQRETFFQIPRVAVISMYMIGHANAAINPCLLVCLNMRFRREFFKLISRSRVQPQTSFLECNHCPAELERQNVKNSLRSHQRGGEQQTRGAWLETRF